ncbi:MAG: LCP family protein, partial [Peptococcaceae bacterium]|nr:LCP family protein [Peptococcaceae bacterium]
SIDPKTSHADVFSIMRDTYVNIPAAHPTKNRINVAYGMGGPQLAVKTVSEFLQLPIKNYILTDFQGFEEAVNAIGGVELNVEKAMNYVDDGSNDINLQPGWQQLNGHQALGYARFRHDAQGDYARVERQRKLLKAIQNKVQGIRAVYYLPRLISALTPYIKTNLDLPGLVNLAYLGCVIHTVETYTIPLPDAHSLAKIDGMSVLLPDLAKSRQEVKQLLDAKGR